MGTEIKPLVGQPGLFRIREVEGLGATRYGGTQLFRRATRRTALADALNELEATRYGGTQTFHRTTRRTALAELGFNPSAAEEIKPGQVAGISVGLNVFVQQQAVSQGALDNLYRPALAQLGYDVSTSTLTTDALTWGWKKDGDIWVAIITKGPDKFMGKEGAVFAGEAAPTALDLRDAPKAVEQYTLIIRPKDSVLTQPKIDALKSVLRNAQKTLKSNAPGVSIEQLLTTKGVAAPFNYAWLAIIGIGATAIVALDHPKVQAKLKRVRGPKKPGHFKNPFRGRRYG